MEPRKTEENVNQRELVSVYTGGAFGFLFSYGVTLATIHKVTAVTR